MDSRNGNWVTREKSPIAHEWIISAERLRQLRTSKAPVKRLCSNFFNVPCHDELLYGFHFIFTGDQNNLGKAVIKFELHNLWEKCQSKLLFTIESADFLVESKAMHFGSFSSTKVVICRADKLFDPKKQFIVDGKLIIKCEGFIYHNEIHPSLKDIDDSGLHSVKESKELWENSNGKTCCIDVNGEPLYLHPEIFHHLFEKSFRQNPIVSGFSYDSVELAIKFNYDFRLVYPLTIEESLEIFKFMKTYGWKGITYEFERYLIEQINESTVCVVLKCAVECNDSKIKSYCFEFLLKCLKESIPLSDYELLPKKLALELLETSLTKFSY